MNTPTHALLSLALLARDRRLPTKAVLLGAVLPDLPMLAFWLLQRGAGRSDAEIWGTIYFQPDWQLLFDAFNSFPLVLALLLVAWLRRDPSSGGLAASMALHLAGDAAFAQEAAHRHFWPLSDWQWVSPVSTWDPAHFGVFGAGLEVVLVVACAAALWGRYATRVARAALAGTAGVSAAGWLAFFVSGAEQVPVAAPEAVAAASKAAPTPSARKAPPTDRPRTRATPAPVADGCPADMARAEGRDGPFCIHRHEVRVVGHPGNADQGVAFPDGSSKGPIISEAGAMPSRVSWYQAYGVCAAAGLHLCTSQEWEDACDGQPGPGGADHGTPDGTLAVGQCGVQAVGRGFHPDLAVTGSYPDCVTPTGIYDLIGNAWEWADPRRVDGDGVPLTDKRGGGHYTGKVLTCATRPGTQDPHPPDFTGSISFRCCVGLRE